MQKQKRLSGQDIKRLNNIKDDQKWSNMSNPQNAHHLQEFSRDTFPIDRPCNLISRTIPALQRWHDEAAFHFSRNCHNFTRLPCTDLCRSLVGNAKRATLSNKGTCHNMFWKYVSSLPIEAWRFVPDLIWATSSPCARITDALPATNKYLVKARGSPVGQDNPGWPKNFHQDMKFNAAGRHDSLPQTATLAIFNDAFPRSIIYLREGLEFRSKRLWNKSCKARSKQWNRNLISEFTGGFQEIDTSIDHASFSPWVGLVLRWDLAWRRPHRPSWTLNKCAMLSPHPYHLQISTVSIAPPTIPQIHTNSNKFKMCLCQATGSIEQRMLDLQNSWEPSKNILHHFRFAADSLLRRASTDPASASGSKRWNLGYNNAIMQYNARIAMFLTRCP